MREPVSWRDKELRVARIVASDIPVAIPDGTSITFLWSADGRVAGKAPVNRYFGILEESEKGQLRWEGGVSSTRMGGAPDLMKLESVYLKVLGSVSRVTAKERSLVLTTQDRHTVVELVP